MFCRLMISLFPAVLLLHSSEGFCAAALCRSHIRHRAEDTRKFRCDPCIRNKLQVDCKSHEIIPGQPPRRPVYTAKKHHHPKCENEGESGEVLVPADTRAPRIFLDAVNGLQPGMVLVLSEAQTHYVVGVMRLRNGDRVRVFDGSSGEFLARVCGVRNSRGKGKRAGAAVEEQPALHVECLTRSQMVVRDTSIPEIELLFAPIRKQRLKTLVEKAVEVGAWRLTPILTARTQSSAADPEILSKLGVFAIEASEQCERMDVPRVGTNPIPLSLLLDSAQADRVGNAHDDDVDSRKTTVWHRPRTRGNIFVCKERDTDAIPLLKALEEFAQDHTAEKIRDGCVNPAFLIGPEGGFSPEEIEVMGRCPDVRFVSLGPSVLRAETAAVYALSCWNAFWSAMASKVAPVAIAVES